MADVIDNRKWTKVPIKEIYEGLYDGPHATPMPAVNGPVFLGIKNITDDGKLDLSEIRHISEEDFSKWTKRIRPRPGDIVFTYEATLNRYAVIPDGFRGCLGRRLALIRPNPLKIDMKYLFYYFFSEEWRKTISQKTIFGSTVDRIPLISFPEFEISVPPLPTQRKIAAILSAYDDLIENNTRRIKILEEMAQALYREWFVHFRFPGHEKVRMVDSPLGEIPEGWEVYALGQFGDVRTGKTPSKLVPEYFGDHTPFIKIPDMHGNMFCIRTSEYLSQAGMESQRKNTLPPNALCVSCIGSVGLVTITTVPSQTNQQINSIILKNNSDREFLYFALCGLKEIIKKYGMTGATMSNLSRGKFIDLKLIYPHKKHLENFHEATYPVFEEIKLLQVKNENLRSTRDLLLPRLISGEVDLEQKGICGAVGIA